MEKFGSKLAQDLSHKLAQKRILYVINANSGGGVEQLAKALQSDEVYKDALVKNLYLYSGANLSKLGKVMGILKVIADILKFRPDILVTFQPTSSVIASIFARLARCKIRIIHQSNLPSLTHKLPRWLDRMAGRLGFYSVIIMNSKATCRAFSDYPAPYQKRLRYIAHGIDWSAPNKSRQEIRKTLNISKQQKILFCCARLSKEKALHTVIQALPCLPADSLFIIAGAGPCLQELQDLAADLGVEAQVRFLGHIDQTQLFEMHKAADLFVFPSLTETFGMAVLEAAMSGLPVVASDIAPLREVLGMDKPDDMLGQGSSLFVPDWQPQSWAKAIAAALEHENLAQQAAAFAPIVRRLYSTDHMLSHYHKLYQDML